MRYSATIDLGLKCIRKFDRAGGAQSIAVVRVPVLALRSNVWRDFLDIIRQRAPPRPTPTEVFAFFRRWPLPANVNSHCHRLACALTVIGEKMSPAILGLQKCCISALSTGSVTSTTLGGAQHIGECLVALETLGSGKQLCAPLGYILTGKS